MNIANAHRYTGPLSQAIESAITRMYWNEVYTGDAPCPLEHYGIGKCSCHFGPAPKIEAEEAAE